MKTNSNKWLLSLLVVMLALCLVTGAFFACNPDDIDKPNPTPTTEGAEKGVYSSDDVILTLNGFGAFTLSQGAEVFSGAYTSDESGVLNLTFAKSEDGTATCKSEDNVLVFTHGGSEYRLYKQLKFVVTFNDGQSTSVANVTNGGYASKPEDPVKEGYKFVGWYANADFSGKPYSFDAEKVTNDITLYARWVQYDKTAKEFTVSFDLGYEATIASQKTIGGKLLDTELPAPQREGYTFKGWWVSASNDKDKLTYQYKDGDAFTADTTLFALWQQDGTTLATLEVTASGASWAGVEGAAKLVITKPDKTTVEHNIGASGSAAYEFDLSAQPAGEYKYVLTYGETTVERYYLNKVLARVSGFSVVGNSVLLFDGVDNAEAYYITVKCGNEAHNHTEVYIGLSTNYNFVNCSMMQGGIEFTVKATAKGYYESVATFKFDRTLDAVTDIAYDAATGMLTWASVANAQHYIVKIGDNEYYLGTENKLDVKELPAGELAVSVQAYTEGYNSAAATTATINKTGIAAPTQLAVDGNSVLTWSAVEGATSYKLQIGNKTATAETNQFTLDSGFISLGNEYQIMVKAVVGDAESLWSDALVVNSSKADAGMFGLTYNKGTFSWTTMLDATAYEYKVNGGKAQTTTQNSAAVTLTKAGTNQLQVRYLSLSGEYSEWTTLEVYAYTLTFDSVGGNGVNTQYKAIGDAIELPVTTRVGYEFDGWYNVYGGSEANGAKFTSKTFDGTANLVLYANWNPCTYTITLDYNVNGQGDTENVTVTYTKSYTLPVPTMLDDEISAQKAFAGWNTSADGNGTQFTDESGVSITYWNLTSDVTLYAKYVDAFSFSPDGEGGYSVKASKKLGYYTKNLIIPAKYNGVVVRSIAEYGFKGYPYLENISLPDTLESIPSTAFDGCTRIKQYTVYETDHSSDPTFQAKYSSVNGSVLQTLYGEKTLHLIPTATTGTYRVPEGITAIGSRTFNKAKFDTVVIPNSVISVEADAFVGCSSLKSIIFEQPAEGEDVQKLTIDSKAFNETLYVESFVLPARLAEINNVQEFFSQFKLLSSIQIEGVFNDQVYASLDENDGGQNIAGMLANAAKDTIVYCPINLNANGASKDFEVVVPAKIIIVADHAFDSFEEAKAVALKLYNPVTKVTFDNIVSVGEYAFNKSRNLEEVVFKGITDPVELTIGQYAFYKCSSLKHVTFEEEGKWTETEEGSTFTATKSTGLAEIGDYAFAESSLNELSLPNSLKEIGAHAFERCSALGVLELGNVSSDLTFGDYAFGRCNALTNVELTKNVGLIDFNLVFYDCRNLKLTPSKDNPNFSIDDNNVIFSADGTILLFFPDNLETYVIPETVTKIGGAVFKDNTTLKSITIGANVSEIGDSAFEECSNLASVTIVADGSDLTIGAKAFYNCTSLASIELPGRVVSIGNECFRYFGTQDRALTTITLNEGLKTIGDKAFYTTSNLEGINIPASVTSIGSEAFGQSGIKTLTFAERNGAELTIGKAAFTYCANLEAAVLPEGLANIPQEMFNSNKLLKSVTVPSTVRNFVGEETFAVGRKAFYGCELLSEIVFTKGGTEDLSFGGEAFFGCDALTTLSLPNRVASIDSSKYDLFEMGMAVLGLGSGTYGMTNSNVYAWKNGSYTGTNPISNIETVEVEEGGKYFSSYDGVLYNADKTVLVWVPFAKKGNVEIAKETTTLRPGSFYCCPNITSITFQEGGTSDFKIDDATKTGSYGDTVFYGCYNLTSIKFPARLTKLGDYALYSDTGMKVNNVYVSILGLTSVTFDENCKLTSIGTNAFENLDQLSSLKLPDSVVTIGKFAFRKTNINQITISAALDAQSFTNALSSLPTGVQIDGIQGEGSIIYEDGIYYSKGKKDLLYANASFDSDTIVIPASVTNIGDNAFKGKTTLKTVIFEDGTEPLTIGTYAFSGSGITSIELPARVSSMDTYVFSACSSLETVTFEAGYKYSVIPDYTFMNCVALQSISIPGEVTSIGRSAFSGAGTKTGTKASGGLATVSFELTSDGQLSLMASISADAFNNCYALSNIRLALSKDSEGNVTYADNTLPYAITILGQQNTYLSGPFKNCISLTELTLPNELTFISKGMFTGCTSLTNVKLPSRLTEIKQSAFESTAIGQLDLSQYENASLTIYEGAFKSCKNLSSFDFAKVKTLYLKDTFASCTALKSVNFPESIELFGTQDSPASTYNYKAFTSSGLTEVTINRDVLENMFNGCTSLTKVTLGSAVSAIKDSAFNGCTKLDTVDTSAVLLLSVENSAFKGCTKLAAFDFSKVVEIGKYSFQNCSSLQSVGTFNDKITALPDEVFSGAGVTSIDLVNSNITSIGSKAFNATKLVTLTLPDTLESIGSSAFASCTALTTVVYDCPLSIPSSLFSGCTSLSSVTLNDQIESIGASAFAKTAITTIDIHNVAKLESKVFDGCTKLTTLKLSNSEIQFNTNYDMFNGVFGFEFEVPENSGLDADGSALYSGTTLLLYTGKEKVVTVKDGTTKIAAGAFINNTNIEEVILPASVTTIVPYKTFSGCTNLKKINLENILSWAYDNPYNPFEKTAITELTVFTTGEKVFRNMTNLTKVTIIGEQAAIEPYAFYGCTSLTTVIGDIVYVDEYAFSGCTKLASFEPFKNVTHIGMRAFEKTAFTEVTLSEGTEELGNYAFASNTALTTVNLPDSLTAIGSSAFSGCTKLSAINLDKVTSYGTNALEKTALVSVTLAEGVTAIPNYLFNGCTSLQTVVLPSSVTSIGNYAFYGCTKLASINLDNVTSIGNNAFYNCKALTSLTITGKTTSIGSNAFYGWTTSQTINFVDHTEAGDDWSSSWNRSCNANIVWKTEPEKEITEQE